KLPPEALDVLRFLGKTAGGATTEAIEEGTGLASRPVGKAIRRLVTADYISLGFSGYELTTDGKVAVQELAAFDGESGAASPAKQEAQAPTIARRLIAVVPRTLAAGQPADMIVGVNPPAGSDGTLSDAAHLELKLRAQGGALSSDNLTLEVPPNAAAQPGTISLTPAAPGKTMRVRIDAFQAFDFDRLESVGGMYFDVPVAANGAQPDATNRAVGIDLKLKLAR
ncbi:MAG: hypothetical protein IT324_19150, partial [Anaerolineae bacterium]|nr:hypothetical protein [Anaerolineae bacterium]